MWILVERKCVFAGIQFTKYFIELVFVETNGVVHSGFRHDLDAANLRPALEQGASILFFRIWYMFSISKCRAGPVLGLYFSLVCKENAAAQCHMQFFFQEFELRTRFVFKNRVEPSQLDFRLTGTDRLQTCFLTFFSLLGWAGSTQILDFWV